jgi:hypothetical protein
MRKNVEPNWILVKVDQTNIVGEEYRRSHGIVRCGVYYLLNANRHVYICSLTPCIEAFAMHAFVEYENFEAHEADGGEAEIELMEEEETPVLVRRNSYRTATKTSPKTSIRRESRTRSVNTS